MQIFKKDIHVIFELIPILILFFNIENIWNWIVKWNRISILSNLNIVEDISLETSMRED